jgi:NADH-quinone oxidoreductase subunit L
MQDLFPIQHSYLIPLLPLLGAAIAGFFGAYWLKGKSHWPIWLGVGASAILSVWLLVGMLGIPADPAGGHGNLTLVQDWFTWIEAGAFKVTAGFLFDPLTAVMLCVVCGIGFLITVFAAGYMHGEAGYWRFFAYLGLFIFMMTCLVMGGNLIMLYLGWEGVGLCSYLLIGYYYERDEARDAARKAFIGDFGFGIGIMLTYYVFGTVSYFDGPTQRGFLSMLMDPAFMATLGDWEHSLIYAIPFCLMLGAFGKSAQFPLYVWLPDAMAGPTPVSALIHAATMVTAGVYMITRCGPIFFQNTAAMATIAVVGAFTALFSATIALRQYDLKKVFAYSTVSQLGFMFVGVAALAPVAGIFHLVTHAFFKALLFLASGVVMHACHDVLDMRKMSGLKRELPKTRWLMLIGCLALAGFPLITSGFYSKDEIVAAAWHFDVLLGVVMLGTAFLTAYYTFRLYFRVFHGPTVVPDPAPLPHLDEDHPGHEKYTGHDEHHEHEPFIMIGPLVVLAIGAIFAGLLNFPIDIGLPTHKLGEFLGQSPSLVHGYAQANEAFHGHASPLGFGQLEAHEQLPKNELEAEHSLHLYMMIGSGLLAIAGILLARLLHYKNRDVVERASAKVPGVVKLLENKYWVDELYHAVIVRPLKWVADVAYAFDRMIIDGVLGLICFLPQFSGWLLKLFTQRGHLQGYAAWMLFAVVVILWIVLT